MSLVPVTIHRRGVRLLESALLARTLGSRLKGLLGTTSLAEGHGLVIPKCRQVHTFFMRYPIDVVFLDARNTVLKVQTLRPWKFSSWQLRAVSVLELPAGFAQRQALAPGDKLEVQPHDPS